MIRIAGNEHLFVLTGAGISVESGLPTFRAEDGLWAGERVDEVCTPRAWERDPWKVWQFYVKRRAAALAVRPNQAHYALAELEAKLEAGGGSLFLCTQNVDNLHEAGGSKHVHHMHGELFKSRCSDDCSPPVDDITIYKTLDEVPRCHCGALMRPHITFFGEVPDGITAIGKRLESATMLLVVGTSGVVRPASQFVTDADDAGIRTVYSGLEKPINHHQFSETFLGKASEMQFKIT